MYRIALAVLAAAALTWPRTGDAQEDYRTRRERLAKEIEARQKELSEAKGQRVQLQARVDSVIAQLMDERARSLVLGSEATALQQLDALLTTTQDNLLAQRERFASLGDAVGRRGGATLVVLLRADSSTTQQTITSVSVTVDGTAAETRTYTPQASNALRQGGVDQIYRAPVLPAAHTVNLQVVADGRTLTQSVSLEALGESVTYVQFALRNGQLTQSMWTSKGTAP